jgi:hypothetical protein
MPSFGGEVYVASTSMSHVAGLRHVKDPYIDVEVTSIGKIDRPFLAKIPPFAVRGLSRHSYVERAWRLKWEL